jgi:anti-sigma regulatory factor (Ser/Thr protein kinase)
MTRKLVFKSDPAELAGVRAEVRRFLKAAACRDADAERIAVALSEACTNITRHTYDGDPARTIRLACEATGRGIRFRLRDYGPHVRAAQLRPRPARELKPGGLGLVLMRKTFTSLKLVNHPRGNELILEFAF